MSGPRLNGNHLSISRFDLYGAVVDELLNGRGDHTAAADVLARPPAFPGAPARRDAPPPGGTYVLVDGRTGARHPLRLGINALGRYPDNDLVLEPSTVSRRHCVVLVHAGGWCEVYDTASRNGTYVNGHRVGRADLLPGDRLALCQETFAVTWEGPTEIEADTPLVAFAPTG